MAPLLNYDNYCTSWFILLSVLSNRIQIRSFTRRESEEQERFYCLVLQLKSLMSCFYTY
jgi:hypothetical protein